MDMENRKEKQLHMLEIHVGLCASSAKREDD